MQRRYKYKCGHRKRFRLRDARSDGAALPAQDGQLMSQGDEFQFQRGSATKPESEQGHEGEEHRDHADDVVAAAQ